MRDWEAKQLTKRYTFYALLAFALVCVIVSNWKWVAETIKNLL